MVAAGKLSPGELRSSAWRRLFRDVYVCADVQVTHQLRAVAAAGLLVPGAVVTGRSAAVLWGVPVAERDDDVELTVPPGSNICRVPGITVRRRALDPLDITVRQGTRLTTAEVTAIDLARCGPLDDAVVLIDQFVDAGIDASGDGARGGRDGVRAGLPAGTGGSGAGRRPGRLAT